MRRKPPQYGRRKGLIGSVLARFRQDRSGATSVEFAIISIPFIGLLFAIFESAFVFFSQQGLEAAVGDAARIIMTGQAQAATYTTGSQFRDATICNPTTQNRILPSFIDCSTLVVDVRTAGSSGSTSFGSADLSRTFYAGSTKYCTGAPQDVVIVRVAYPMPVYMTLLSQTGSIGSFAPNTAGQVNYGGGMKHMLIATSVFRNEPFNGYTGAQPGC